jgi:hypothetical protein
VVHGSSSVLQSGASTHGTPSPNSLYWLQLEPQLKLHCLLTLDALVALVPVPECSAPQRDDLEVEPGKLPAGCRLP